MKPSTARTLSAMMISLAFSWLTNAIGAQGIILFFVVLTWLNQVAAENK